MGKYHKLQSGKDSPSPGKMGFKKLAQKSSGPKTSKLRIKKSLERKGPIHHKVKGSWLYDRKAKTRTWMGGRRKSPPDPLYQDYEEQEQPLLTLPDLPKSSGGSLKSLRSEPSHEWTGLEMLRDAAWAEDFVSGEFHDGSRALKGDDGLPVLAHAPRREKGLHRKIFNQNTGFTSATKYAKSLAPRAPGMKYEILHAKGVGEVGPKSQDISNLAAASRGANSQMIPYDKAVAGNPNITVSSYFVKAHGTHMAREIHQIYKHKATGDTPIHQGEVHPHRSELTREEWDYHEGEAAKLKAHIAELDRQWAAKQANAGSAPVLSPFSSSTGAIFGGTGK